MNYALISYIPILLLYFEFSKDKTIFESFRLGLYSYGIFDFTNLALFERYDITTALQDIFWGGFLFGATKAF